MRVMEGAFSQVAYSASMNSYNSLTDAPPRSTPRLLKENRLSSAARGSRAPARAAERAPKAAAAAHPPRAFPGTPGPSSRGWSHLSRAPAPPQQSDATSRSPSALLPHETQERTSCISLTPDAILSAEDPKGSAVRKVGGTPASRPSVCKLLAGSVSASH